MAGGDHTGYLKQSRKQFRAQGDGGCPWWNESRPYSRWEAWQDLLQSAAFSAHSRMVSGALLVLERGETPPRSIRFLAARWSRSEKWVRVFLELGEKMDRIRAHQRTPEGHTYLIVNYEVYQSEGHGQGTAESTARAQPGHSQGTKYKKSKKIEEGEEEELLAPSFAQRDAGAGGAGGAMGGGGAGANGHQPPSNTKREPDLLWEALMAVCGVNGQIPKSARGAYNRARSELAAAGATPEEIQRRAAIYVRQWPTVSLTPTALARRWAECEREMKPRSGPSRRPIEARSETEGEPSAEILWGGER